MLKSGVALYVLMWMGGVASYVLRGGPRPHEAWTAPVFLALAAAIVLAKAPRRQAAWLAAVAAAGYLVELAGDRCSCIFGAYDYSAALAPRLFGVPLVMAAAWMVLVAYVKAMLAGIGLRPAAEVLAGSALMTAIDLVLDPLAAGPLGYWSWKAAGGYYGVPASNFAGWFVVSAAIFVALTRVPRWPRQAAAVHVGGSIVLFFTVIALAKGLVVPAAIGVALSAGHLVLASRRAYS